MKKKSIYIFPTIKEFFVEGNNNYIKCLIQHLEKDFTIVSKITKLGIFDIFLKIHKCNILYFNWVEDIPGRRFGILQFVALFIIIVLSKILRVQIVWFVHNNISHNSKRIFFKKMIVSLMRKHADIIISHSSDLRLPVKNKQIFSFDHPLDFYSPIVTHNPTEYDLLIWGTVTPYKGIAEFIDYLGQSSSLKDLRVLIAGKFISDDYFEAVNAKTTKNVQIINKRLSEAELIECFSKTKYILFTYNSPSVLSSGALCKSLSFGKEVIGPNVGSFKELGRKGLIYNYESFDSLESLIKKLKEGRMQTIDAKVLACYAENNRWPDFAMFLSRTLNN